MTGMNNTGWQYARRAVGLERLRVHDVRHTFACRLRAAGVTAEDRAALLGHAEHSMSGHYASADVGRLVELANLVLSVMRRVPCCAWPTAGRWSRRPSTCG